MATLSEVSALTRTLLKWGGILLLALIILTLLARIGMGIRNRFFPPPPPAPTVAFGKLPPLAFPKSVTSQTFSFSLETITGSFPSFPSQVNVYKIAKARPSLLSLQGARQKVARVGFRRGERSLSGELYRWDDPQEDGRYISLDIVTNDFEMFSNFYNQSDVLAAKDLPNPKKAKEAAQNFLAALDLLPADIDPDLAKVSFFTIQGNFVLPETSLANAQVIRVDLFQKKFNDLPILYALRNRSSMHMLIADTKIREKQVVEAHFFHRAADPNTFSTYPLKRVEDAFEELKSGKAYILGIDDMRKTNIAITNIFLGYYVDKDSKDFLYPVFVFEGDSEFLAYVLAIAPSWVASEEPTR